MTEEGVVKFSIKFPKILFRKMDNAVKKGYYASKADLIREAVRRLIKEIEEKEGAEL